MRPHSDGQGNVLGALGSPKQDRRAASQGDQRPQSFTLGEGLPCPLEELVLQSGIALDVLLAVHVPGSDGALQVVEVEILVRFSVLGAGNDADRLPLGSGLARAHFEGGSLCESGCLHCGERHLALLRAWVELEWVGATRSDKGEVREAGGIL